MNGATRVKYTDKNPSICRPIGRGATLNCGAQFDYDYYVRERSREREHEREHEHEHEQGDRHC